MSVSVGVKFTCKVCPAPAVNTVPAGGAYTIVPVTEAVAFNCVALSAVPYTMSAGLLHVITGVAFVTVIATVLKVAV